MWVCLLAYKKAYNNNNKKLNSLLNISTNFSLPGLECKEVERKGGKMGDNKTDREPFRSSNQTGLATREKYQ